MAPIDDTIKGQVASARVESCGGWRLNSLPQVKRFIYDDVPLYHNVEFKHIPGATPELLLLNAEGKELKRINLSKMTQEECNELLLEYNFYRKKTAEEPVPDEHLHRPLPKPIHEMDL